MPERPPPKILPELGIALGVVAMVPRLLFAMQMDQSFHHYLGWMVTKGGPPYVASFDQNFPGGAFIYALAILIFGTSAFGFALFDLIVQAITCFLIARLCLRLDKTGIAAFFAPVLYGFTYIGLGVWDTGQRDCFVAPMLVYFVTLIIQADTEERISTAVWAKAGLVLGLMFLTRPMMVLVGAAGLYVLFSHREWKLTDARRELASLVFFALVPVVVLVAIYIQAGHITELYEATIEFNLEVYSKFRHGVTFRGSGEMTPFYVVGIVLAAILCRRSYRYPALLLIVCLVAPLSTFIQGQGDAHHMVPTYAVASVLAGLGFSAFFESRWLKSARLRGGLLAIVAIAIVFMGIPRVPVALVHAFFDGKPLEEIYGMQKRGEMDLRDEIAVGKYLRSRMVYDERLQIFSMRLWPYVLSGHTASSRFQTHEHLLMQPRDQPLTELQHKWREEFMRDLAAKPPRYVLLTTDDHLWLLPKAESSIDQLKRFPEFDSLLRADYSVDTTIGSFRILRRLG
jgi:hypothetical protein